MLSLPSILLRYVLRVLGLFVALLPVGHAFGHAFQVEPVSIILRPQDKFINAEFIGNVQDITQTVNVEANEKRGDEFAPAVLKRMTEYLNQHLVISQGGEKLKGEVVNLRFNAQLDPTQSRFTMVARYPRAHLDTAAKNKPITITSTLFDYLPNAVSMVTVGGLVHKLVSTDSSANSATIDPSAFVSNLFINIRDFMSLGIEHIFTGPDHICFILAFMLVAPNLKSLIKTLTGFTVAHSLTLILLTLGVIHVNPKWVDVAVALSIVYVGVENLVLKNQNWRFWVASGFGLVHGMAFAGNLKDAGLPEGSALFWSLLSFNLGVEAAQVIICVACFPLLMKWKASTEKTGRAGGLSWKAITNIVSVGIIIAGTYWLIQRAFGGSA